MKMRAHIWKRWILWGLAGVVVLDAALLIFVWRNGAEKSQAEGLERLRIQHKLWADDVGRAREIRAHLPQVREQCNEFYAEQLRPTAGGYPAVVADLAEVASKTGLRASAVTYRERAIKDRGVVEVAVTASVEGDYASLVRFINGLERSKNFYLLDNLTMGTATGGGLKLSLELKTYFRS